jgi:hypothetical protein
MSAPGKARVFTTDGDIAFSSFDDDMSLADARLIAAAPDLLAACKSALEAGVQGTTRRELLRAAIAKTEGR